MPGVEDLSIFRADVSRELLELPGLLAELNEKLNEKIQKKVPETIRDLIIGGRIDAVALGLFYPEISKDPKYIDGLSSLHSYKEGLNEWLKKNAIESYNHLNREIFRVAKTLIADEIFPGRLTIRASEYDSYFNRVDELVIDIENKRIVGIYDIVVHRGGKPPYEEILKQIITGVVRFGLGFDEGGNLKPELNSIIPVVCIEFSQEMVREFAEAVILPKRTKESQKKINGAIYKLRSSILEFIKNLQKALEGARVNPEIAQALIGEQIRTIYRYMTLGSIIEELNNRYDNIKTALFGTEKDEEILPPKKRRGRPPKRKT